MLSSRDSASIGIWLGLLSMSLLGCPGPSSGGGGDWFKVHAGPQGGSYSFESGKAGVRGLEVKVPAGAVTEPIDLEFRFVPVEELGFLAGSRILQTENLLFALDARPDGQTFEVPVSLVVSMDQLEPGIRPILHLLDLENQTFDTNRDCDYVLDPASATMELIMPHFTTPAAEVKDETKVDECTKPENTTCRCGMFKFKYKNDSATCQTGDKICQVLKSDLEMQYLDCEGQPNEDSLFQKVSKECVPALELDKGPIYLAAGKGVDLTAVVKLSCATWEGTEVTFKANGPEGTGFLLNDTATSDWYGKAPASFQAGDNEGTVTIEASGTVEYNLTRITAGGETNASQLLSVPVSKTVKINVYEEPIFNLEADPDAIHPRESSTISAHIFRKGEPVNDVTVNFTATGPADLGSSSKKTVNGSASVALTAQDSDGAVTVNASADVPIPMPDGTTQNVSYSDSVEVNVAQQRWRVTLTLEAHSDVPTNCQWGHGWENEDWCENNPAIEYTEIHVVSTVSALLAKGGDGLTGRGEGLHVPSVAVLESDSCTEHEDLSFSIDCTAISYESDPWVVDMNAIELQPGSYSLIPDVHADLIRVEPVYSCTRCKITDQPQCRDVPTCVDFDGTTLCSPNLSLAVIDASQFLLSDAVSGLEFSDSRSSYQFANEKQGVLSGLFQDGCHPAVFRYQIDLNKE